MVSAMADVRPPIFADDLPPPVDARHYVREILRVSEELRAAGGAKGPARLPIVYVHGSQLSDFALRVLPTLGETLAGTEAVWGRGPWASHGVNFTGASLSAGTIGDFWANLWGSAARRLQTALSGAGLGLGVGWGLDGAERRRELGGRVTDETVVRPPLPIVLISGSAVDSVPGASWELYTTAPASRSATARGFATDPSIVQDAVLHVIEHPMVHMMFAQNPDVVHPWLVPLPDGIDFHTMARPLRAGQDAGRWGESASPLEQHLDLLRVPRKPHAQRTHKAIINFSRSSNPIRAVIFDKLGSDPSASVTLGRMPRNELWTTTAQHAFVISPPGAGRDTHRTWEALALGCYPIVEYDAAAVMMLRGLPVVAVESWADVTAERLRYWKQVLDARFGFDVDVLAGFNLDMKSRRRLAGAANGTSLHHPPTGLHIRRGGAVADLPPPRPHERPAVAAAEAAEAQLMAARRLVDVSVGGKSVALAVSPLAYDIAYDGRLGMRFWLDRVWSVAADGATK
jgi:hypothetical protein